jgi:hypothetical protein
MEMGFGPTLALRFGFMFNPWQRQVKKGPPRHAETVPSPARFALG